MQRRKKQNGPHWRRDVRSFFRRTETGETLLGIGLCICPNYTTTTAGLKETVALICLLITQLAGTPTPGFILLISSDGSRSISVKSRKIGRVLNWSLLGRAITT